MRTAAAIRKQEKAALKAEQDRLRLEVFPKRKKMFYAPSSDWLRSLCFLLSMSLLGLYFYPAILLIVALLINSYQRNRYHFMIQVLIVSCGLGLVSDEVLPFKRYDILIVAALIGFFFVKKSMPEVRRTLQLYGVFVVITFAFAFMSAEALIVQLRAIRQYLAFIVFVIPLLIFAKRKFDAAEFFRVLGVYALIMCMFYVFDGFIVRGWMLLPATFTTHIPSTWIYLDIRPHILTYYPRKYPNGLILLLMIIFPLLKFYRFNVWQWGLLALALVTSRTMTVIASLVVTYIIFQGGLKRLLIGVGIGVVAIVGLYHLDKQLDGFLRVASTIEQFQSLDKMAEREDMAEFGSSRAAQIIPKMELLYEQGRQWVGFGFLHPEGSTANQFQLNNDLYSEIEQADENAAVVEETHFQTIIYVGYLGLIIQTCFFIILYLIIRQLPLSSYYLSVLIGLELAGLGGFWTLNGYAGMLPLAWSFAVVILQARRDDSGGLNLIKIRR